MKPIPSKSWSVPFCSGPERVRGALRAQQGPVGTSGPKGPFGPGRKKERTRNWKDRCQFSDRIAEWPYVFLLFAETPADIASERRVQLAKSILYDPEDTLHNLAWKVC